tara:strand:- start:81 stop:440 length:360 start_codon:yes stop_codon:yes gene_type:complete
MLNRRRRKKSTQKEPESEVQIQEVNKMNLSVVLVFSTLITIGGTLLGFMIGWLSHAYYSGFVDSVAEVLSAQEEPELSYTPHPEMMDDEGNPIPFHVAKLISVEFDQRDAFDTDPFPDD